ncbi:uncharacterized protein I303_102202 [Kwoniella dejecticola CBS 10117]|uniref:Ubiquitin-like domain-containing protein n=1 Tax=Kwoniella dejecticola CBS 10117 TaxID=1296121 RepID=A0A1A6ABL0_9TREE|nr:uncharacterized protein I303_01657 [Kwoniella dejecticola CBS 10117]OBR87452.1 hypothetical protein I303_01657 [Kwoniella dejecticola CBS 10117]
MSTTLAAPIEDIHPTPTPVEPSHPLDPAVQHPPIQSQPTEAAESINSNPSIPPTPKVHVKVLIISGQTKVLSFEPEMTVGRMKELIWSSWPSDWTDPAQPPSPSYLRILHAGRILQDDSTLSSNNLPISDTPSSLTVVHISVRSFSIRAEDDPKKPHGLGRTTSVSRSHRGEDDVGGCKCVIM